MKPESNRPITIEDLLQLKRAERPPAEFWTNFDRELRAKQLAALVAKRPWWQNLPTAFSWLLRYRVLLGATAVLAVTFFTVRNDDSISTAEHASTIGESVVAEVVADVSPSTHQVAYAEEVAQPSSVSLTAAQENIAPASTVAAQSPTHSEMPRVLPLGGVIAMDDSAEFETPAGHYVAANLASMQLSDPVVSRSLLDAVNGFEARAMPARTAVEPLQQMTPPSDTRRSRLLTAMVSTASLESSMRTTERAASRIDEERLYDQIHRFGARGDRVQMKF